MFYFVGQILSFIVFLVLDLCSLTQLESKYQIWAKLELYWALYYHWKIGFEKVWSGFQDLKFLVRSVRKIMFGMSLKCWKVPRRNFQLISS